MRMKSRNTHLYSTHIRYLYSQGMSSLYTSYFRWNLSLRLDPYLSKDERGLSRYDRKNGITTTVNYEGAAALYLTAKYILDGKAPEGMILKLQCGAGAEIILERRPVQNGQSGEMETYFVIANGNGFIPFKFATAQIQVRENRQMVTKTIDTGLTAFMKTVEGYLNCVGGDRHFAKLPDDFDELGNGNNQNQNNNGYQVSYGNTQNAPPINQY